MRHFYLHRGACPVVA